MRGVFISYRRDDTAGYAGRLYDALTAQFGRELVFIDIDSVRAGQDFVNVIEQQIASCSVVIVLIGRGWLNCTDDRGVRRLDAPGDFVRLEISSALRQKKSVIPVLVGGAKMPHPDDLPKPLAALAHLNAIEIFDQLFQDSVRHLVNAIRPLVHPEPGFWRWYRFFASRHRLWLLGAGLLAALGIAGFILSPKRSPDRTDTPQVAPLSSETLVVLDDTGSDPTPVKVTTPGEVTELPPVVPVSRQVMMPGSSSKVNGPVKPHVLWRATVTVGDAWHLLGIAGDGTVYLYDIEHKVVDAIRDGKEEWAYSTPDPLGFDPDGRLWLGDYAFNSRGEGGRITRKSLLPDRATLRLGGAAGQKTNNCTEGKLYARDAKWKEIWKVELDGNCDNVDPVVDPQTGNIYASSDARTLYAVSPDGRLLWTLKQACRQSSVNAYPLPNDAVVVSCRNQPLFALQHGKPLWTSTIGTTGGWYWSETLFDASGNIYVGAEGPTPITELKALDKSGKQIWAVSTGRVSKPSPMGFDSQGRLYVSISVWVVCLSP